MANLIEYTMRKPTYGWKIWAKYLLKKAFVLPILWGIAKRLVNKLAGGYLAKLILPAYGDDQTVAHIKSYNIDEMIPHSQALINHNLSAEHYVLKAHDGKAKLDTVSIIHPNQRQKAVAHQQVILHFVGNGMCYEDNFDSMIQESLETECNVIGFNYRGVGASEGSPKSKDDLIQDGIYQVQFLISQGFSPDNIILNGHSLGGAVATMVARHFHQQGIRLNLFNDRSFSSITNTVKGFIRSKNNNGHEHSTGRAMIAWALRPLIRLGLKLSNWEMDAAKAFTKIPEAYRDYIVVRTQKSERQSHIIDDGVIKHYASIHQALRGQRRKQKQYFTTMIENVDCLTGMTDPITHENIKASKTMLTEAAAKLSDHKMKGDDEDGHAKALSQLQNRRGQSGLAFFKSFVERSYEDHGCQLRNG